MTTTSPEGWVLYDGDCGFCARWVPRWKNLLRRRGLGIAALQEPWVKEKLAVQKPEQLMSDIRLLFADGRVLNGADVYRYVMRRTWWAFPIYVVSVLPLLNRLFDAAYRLFAINRHRFSKACGLGEGSKKS
ncbi:MAG: DUF393 domain-containing protein [Verrucomicrobiota bacterium]